MTLHHYTNAATLPLILANRSLRFTRCDLLDDASEVPFRMALLDQRKFFVSSWSRGTHGEAGMWARYGDADRGVRISLPKVRFPWSKLSVDVSRPTDQIKEDGSPRMVGLRIREVYAPYAEKTLFGNGYMIVPLGSEMETTFGSDVLYATDPLGEVKRRVQLTDGGLNLEGDATYVARVKGIAWADQAEHRFVISAMKGPAMVYAADPSGYLAALLEGIEAGAATGFIDYSTEVRYIDVPLAEDAFEDLVITTGAAMPSAAREDLERRVKDLAPTAVFEQCALKVRPKP
ncbi:hypothetical protein [Stenotrophomonas maltophilia]|uniref:hypothetical protein n=1 Tax=Stenotrophomonas maltophilia TaxID=40324 RepID=UPI0021CAD0A3|nr:hypothetical protein [Stenotrophomonas maltophilia]MCU1172315.1 hypothetical protein [Stenotrophomonas maltophilia]